MMSEKHMIEMNNLNPNDMLTPTEEIDEVIWFYNVSNYIYLIININIYE